jgi:hypothetical protein
MKNLIITLGLASTFLFSCEETLIDDPLSVGTDVAESFESEMIMEISEEEINGQVESSILKTEAQLDNTGGARMAINVSYDSATRRMTIDYGDGHTNQAGKIVAGKVLVDFTGERLAYRRNRRVPLYLRFDEYQISYDGFKVDSVAIGGLRTVTLDRTADSTGATITTTSTLTDGTYTFPGSETITRSGSMTRTKTFEQGYVTVEKSGSFNGVTRQGADYSFTIETPIFKSSECTAAGGRFPIPVSGVSVWKVGNVEIRSLDYGDGTCDDKAILTTPAGETEVTLFQQLPARFRRS